MCVLGCVFTVPWINGENISKILFSIVTNGLFQMEMPLDSTSADWPWNLNILSLRSRIFIFLTDTGCHRPNNSFTNINSMFYFVYKPS